MILGGLIDSLTGANKSARLKGTVVLMRKNVLDLTDLGATIMDGIGDFLGKGVTCQLISSTLVDHAEHGHGMERRDNIMELDAPDKTTAGAEAELEQWVTSLPSLTTGESKFGLTFDWEVEKLGVPGAIIVNNYHSSEFLLKTVTLHDVPGRGSLSFVANSWVYPAASYTYSRVFFANDVSDPFASPLLSFSPAGFVIHGH
ncbi:hypothetical protein CFC21_053522 [Triticum aestivum]|uniref:PLAT domain-containing protein n=2 Tax=Triticum aestivum TaxID=4565 RepID=A0A9R1GC30_WHEAT|nr:hypothetical protein CFC21_053516 [Triticum aestivum]KAF7044269.1 hypothetical protein CFC21_053522 [Triticum aestivum]